MGDLRAITDKKFSATILIFADGFFEDLATCVAAFKAHTSDAIGIYIFALGDGELTNLSDGRTFIIHSKEPSGYGEAINALIKFSNSEYVIIMDPSTIFTGDAIEPVLKKLDEKEYAAVGWRGGLVNTEDEWRSVDDKGEGEVDVLFSYFFAVSKAAAIAAGGIHQSALYYRNADMEFSLKLRQSGARLFQMELALKQERHHGYYDSDPIFREEQSKKNYDRILKRFRGKNEILVPRR